MIVIFFLFMIPTTDNIQGTQCYIGEDIKWFFVQFTLQFICQDGTLLIENINEIIQNFEMESWC